MKILVVGSLGDNLRPALTKLAAMNEKHGPFELLICIGDFFSADPETQAKELQDIVSGTLTIPIPAYIMQAKSAPSDKLLQLAQKTSGQLTDMLTMVDASTVISTPDKLHIAFVNGTLPGSPDSPASTYNKDDLMSVVSSAKSMHRKGKPVGVDVLVTIDWPEHITIGSNAAAKTKPSPAQTKGSVPISNLVSVLAPRYHFAIQPNIVQSSGIFFEREPFHVGGLGVHHITRFIGLADFNNPAKQRWYYAFQITPMAECALDQLKIHTPDTTESPLPAPGQAAQFLGTTTTTTQRRNTKRSAATDAENDGDAGNSNFFWSVASSSQQNAHTKRQRRGEVSGNAGSSGSGVPPETYVCHKCNQGGHWIQDCPVIAKERAEKRGQKRHTKNDDDAGDEDDLIKNDDDVVFENENENAQEEDDDDEDDEDDAEDDTPIPNSNYDCWFCLANPSLERHLIVDIGKHVYVTKAKGGLVPRHLIVIPIGHYKSRQSMKSAEEQGGKNANLALKELEKVRRAVMKMEEANGNEVVTVEVHGGTLFDKSKEDFYHMHVQMIPVPKNSSKSLFRQFTNQFWKMGFQEEQAKLPTDTNMPYVRVQLPNGKVMVYQVHYKKIESYEYDMEMYNEGMEDGENDKDYDRGDNFGFDRRRHYHRRRRHPGQLFDMQAPRKVLANFFKTPNRSDWRTCVLKIEEATLETDQIKAALKPFLKFHS